MAGLNPRSRLIEQRAARELNANGNLAALEEGAQLVILSCECGGTDCSTQFSVAAALYERVRAHPDRFIVMDGHQDPGTDGVVIRHGFIAIVESAERVLDPKHAPTPEP